MRAVDSRRKGPSCRKRRYRCGGCDERWNTYEVTVGVPGAMELPRELLTQFKQHLLLTPNTSKAINLELSTPEELLGELLRREKNK